MLDFGALPPEINSGRMYVGAGSGPMLAAATAWDSWLRSCSPRVVVWVDDRGPGRRAVDRSVLDSDGGGGHALCDVGQYCGCAGRASRRAGQTGRRRL